MKNQIFNHKINEKKNALFNDVPIFLSICRKKNHEIVRKYMILHILKEIGIIGCRPIDSPVDPNQKLMAKQSV